MSDKILRVKMFGGFSMYYGDQAITLNKIGNSKSVRLLKMLLLSLKGGISKSELIEDLYDCGGKTDAVNSNKNLNNLIYRLKGQLMSCGLPEDEYVELNDGICRFHSKVPLDLDTQRFEEAIDAANRLEGGKRRIELLRRANEMYCGELLPANQSEIWFFRKSIYFKKLYVGTIRELEKEYIKNNDYKNRILLYSRAAAIYPFDNWQIKLMRCNLEVYRYEEAVDIYNETMELYAQEMGSPPEAEMQECFETLEIKDKDHKRNGEDINSWREMDKNFIRRKNYIKEAIFEKDKAKGAYYCIFPSFVDYCRLVARIKERNQFDAVLMFLTLTENRKKDIKKQIDIQEQMRILKMAIGDSLRIGDAYTRYGNRHFILMLLHSRKEMCSEIFQRIERAYAEKSGKANLWYFADMTQNLEEAL